MGSGQQIILVTGYPGFISRRLVSRLVEDASDRTGTVDLKQVNRKSSPNPVVT